MNKKSAIFNVCRSKFCLLLLAAWLTALFGGGVPVAHGQAAVFLLDTSQSMQDSDPKRLAPGCVATVGEYLQPGDKLGIITYSTDTHVVRDLAPPEPGKMPDLSAVPYEGYTNTGAAMQQAVEMLRNDTDPKRSIVLLTDGEIMLPSSDSTLHSAQQFSENMERAAQLNIPVYILSLASGPNERDYKLYSGYAKWQVVRGDELVPKTRELASEIFSAPASAQTDTSKEETPPTNSRSKGWAWLLAGLGVAVIGVLYWLTGRKSNVPTDKAVSAVTSPPVKTKKPPLVKVEEPTVIIEPPMPKAAPPPKLAPAVAAKQSYTGKVVLYVMKLATDEDIPPLEYNLYRRGKGQAITLAEIINGCGLKHKFPGADKIVFNPIRDGIIVFNNSDATVTKRGNIVLRNNGTDLYYDEKIHIAFSDETSEMVIIYKSLKPNER